MAPVKVSSHEKALAFSDVIACNGIDAMINLCESLTKPLRFFIKAYDAIPRR